uniref:Protein kinase domain-containing protein n=1 Tax=Labrus bergylta TaxID=56723 RepID=A0A3Q3FFA1_9LABR
MYPNIEENQRSYGERGNHQTKNGWDSSITIDKLQLIKGSSLGHFHKVEAFLGEGGFGVVAKCRNTITNKFVAIKVNKNAPEIYHQARQEIEILKQLRCLDPETCNIVQWNGYFFLKMNICLNFELLDLSLYHYMEGTPEKTLPITEVKDVLYQLSIALSHLSSIGIVHADLKPDNVMVVDRHQKPLRVKLIDFGLASRVSDCQPGMCVQTTWYRAPEVCLYSEFNEAIDMWSLGLTAAELAGQLPDHVLDQGHATGHNSDHGLLVDLIKKMMHLDQDQRIKPQEVLQHPFLTGSLPQNSSADLCNDMTNTEEAVPETRQQPSCPEDCNDMTNTEEAVPETRQQPSCPEDCNDMTNTEEADSDSDSSNDTPKTKRQLCKLWIVDGDQKMETLSGLRLTLKHSVSSEWLVSNQDQQGTPSPELIRFCHASSCL